MNNVTLATVKLSKVYTADKKKDGSEYKTRDGKKMWRVAIKADRFGDDWYTCMAFKADDKVLALKEGQEVRLVYWTEGDFKNFKLASRFDEHEDRLAKLESVVRALSPQKEAPKLVDRAEYPKEEINPEDIPF